MALAIESLSIRNLLSFGPDAEPIELRSLNVIVGPNGSGKSNLIEVLSLLSEMQRNMGAYIRQSGGILHWLWKGAEKTPIGAIVVDGRLENDTPFHHDFELTRVEQGIQVVDESIALRSSGAGRPRKPLFCYENGVPVSRASGKRRALDRSEIDFTQSILGLDQKSEAAFDVRRLGTFYRSFSIYRPQLLTHVEFAKRPQEASQYAGSLAPNAGNLAAVLNRIQNTRGMKKRLNDYLKTFYEDFEDVRLVLEGGTIQIYFEERYLHALVPASRLSDGTFRWLCLLAILLDPEPPRLICLEEPEIGLHPDIEVELAKLLKSTAERTQLIVTTHSDVLVEALSDTPESILVSEKTDGKTSFKRLKQGDLQFWLADYGLGTLWRRGDLGGNRW